MKSVHKKILTAVTAFYVAITSTAYAATYNYDMQGSLTVIGDADTSDAISLVIRPYSATSQTPDDAVVNSNKNIILKSAVVSDNVLRADVNFKESIDNGKYVVSVNEGGAKADIYLFYPDENSLAEYIALINNSDVNVFSTMLKDTSLNWSALISSNYADACAQILFDNRPESGYTAKTLGKTYMLAEAVVLLKNGKININNLLNEYRLYFSADKELTSAQKTKLYEVLSNYSVKLGKIENVLENGLEVTDLLLTGDFQTFGDKLLEYIKANNLSEGKYSSITNTYYKQLAMKSLYEVRNNYYNMPDLYDAFLLHAQTQYAAWINASNSHTSGGGGGGGSSSGGSSPSGFVPVLGDTANETSAQQSENGLYKDISTHWAKTEITFLSERNVINGYTDGTFRPEEYVTRAQFSKMISMLMDLELSDTSVFNDVNAGDWYLPYVSAAEKAGIVNGNNGYFYPDALITREDAAVIIYRALQYKNIGLSSDTNTYFDDTDNISEYAKTAVESLSTMEIINGYDNQFKPKGNTKRAEAAAMLYRLADKTEGVSAE